MRRYSIKKVQPGEKAPKGYTQYAECPSGVTLWRKDLIYGKPEAAPSKKRKPKQAADEQSSINPTTPASEDEAAQESTTTDSANIDEEENDAPSN